MEYNTTRTKLLLPEYGRNVQNMIAHAMELEDRTERNRAAQAIIEVMGQLNPHLRDVDDYRHKLWTHMFVMSDFKLDVDSPYDVPKSEDLTSKPDIVEYPSRRIKYGHYGKYSQKILENSKDISDDKERKYLTRSMANFMKKQFLVYNNDAVENSVIANQLKVLSNNVLEVEDPNQLLTTNSILKAYGIQANQNRNNSKKPTKKKFKK
ncbi:DUF4290 domain-containing protein [Crocinitomicaceae bacterium]|jgi:hypothetical protein|nr:DUF4290 domain-containing protein [Crocinitomicaceae bacterium]